MKTHGVSLLFLRSVPVFGIFVLLASALPAQLPPLAINPVETEVQSTTIQGNLATTPEPGAPFSAVEESVYAQRQPDGSYENRSSITTYFYRDAQGRTRAERYETSFLGSDAGKAKLKSIIVIDPVERVTLHLDPDTHTAQRGAWNGEQLMHGQSANAVTTDAVSQDLRASATTESLGSSTMEGLNVEGTRQTLDVPANTEANEPPSHIVQETWISPELKVAVLTKRDNSSTGTRTTRLTKIAPSEPDPALFEAPTDYKVENVSPENDPVLTVSGFAP